MATETPQFVVLVVNVRGRAGFATNARAIRITPDQIAEAQRLAREWDAAHPREP